MALSKETRSLIIRLYPHYLATEIAEALSKKGTSVTRQTVERIAKRAGIKRTRSESRRLYHQKQRGGKEFDERIIFLYTQMELSAREIVFLMDGKVSRYGVKNILERADSWRDLSEAQSVRYNSKKSPKGRSRLKRIEQAWRYKMDGLRVPEIADRMGRSESTIYRYLKEENCPF